MRTRAGSVNAGSRQRRRVVKFLCAPITRRRRRRLVARSHPSISSENPVVNVADRRRGIDITWCLWQEPRGGNRRIPR